MRRYLLIAVCIIMAAGIISCNNTRRDPGRAYMPDMVYSRAYETYAPTQERLDHSSAAGAHFTGMPVEGTIARGDLMHYTIKNDSSGYTQSEGIKNPLTIATIDVKEAERLYLVNCGICHGTKLDGNGPLYNGGNGPYSAKPATLVGDPLMENMPEGRIFHVVTYGKGQMGSYASQLTTQQRWMVVAYVKGRQNGKAPAAGTDSTAAPKIDSATVKKG